VKDDSDLTINLCIGGNFDSAKLLFNGGNTQYTHKVGRGISHSGDVRHSTAPTEGGEGRWNLLFFIKFNPTADVNQTGDEAASGIPAAIPITSHVM